MQERGRVCDHCGHPYNDTAGYYYSEDFARYLNRTAGFMLQWCYECSYVVEYRRKKILGFLKTNLLSEVNKFYIADFTEHEVSKHVDEDIGGMAITHLLGTIWWSFLERAKIYASETELEEKAIRAIIERLPPYISAYCLYISSQMHLALPQIIQFERGKYLSEYRRPPEVLAEFIEMLKKLESSRAKEALDILLDMKKGMDGSD